MRCAFQSYREDEKKAMLVFQRLDVQLESRQDDSQKLRSNLSLCMRAIFYDQVFSQSSNRFLSMDCNPMEAMLLFSVDSCL